MTRRPAHRRQAPQPAAASTMLRWSISALAILALRSAVGADLYDIAPTTPPRVVDGGYFGTHLHRAVAAPRAPATAWPDGQIGALRLWDSGLRWAEIEPARGRFRFDLLDAYVAQAQAHGASLLLVLGSAPRWAGARPDEPGPYGPGSVCEPADFDDWDRYVAAVAQRYRGRITHYELWNEPYFSDLPADRGQASAFFSGSVATMVELARRARAALDRVDPSAVLLTPGFVGGTQRFEMFLAAGGGRYVGGIAYHYYASDDAEFIALHRAVRATMARHGLAALPVYDTESGYAVAESLGTAEADERLRAAVLLARSMVLGAYLGIERYYQYAWDNGRSGMLVLLSQGPSQGRTPSFAAFEAVRRWLVGTALLGCKRLADDVVRCTGQRGGDHLSIYWRATGEGGAPVRLPADARTLTVDWAAEPRRTADLDGLAAQGLVVGADPVAVWSRATPAAGRSVR